MDFEKIKAAAQAYQADMTRFLRDMISHPSESCEEREVVHCIKAEMEKLGADPCGENGEYHSFVPEGPIFARPIPVAVGPAQLVDGYAVAPLALQTT